MLGGRKKILLATALGLALTTPALAEKIKLISLDGSTTITGEFISFDGEKYTISTILGEFTVDAFQVKCTGDACPVIDTEAEKFAISGSPTLVGGLFSDLMFEFASQIGGTALSSMDEAGNPMVQLQDEAAKELAQISLEPTNSRVGLEHLLSGEAALAVTTRAVRPEEASALGSAGLGDVAGADQETIFALDGLVVVTSRHNPLRAIAEQDLARIFSGAITNWDQIGGPSAAINLYGRAPDSGTGIVFSELVMQPATAEYAATTTILETDAEVTRAVAADPLGIGVTGLADSAGAKVLAIRGTCGIQVPATPFTIKTEEYPLSRRIYAYQGTSVPVQLSRFLQFLETPAARAVISDAGFVDLGVSYQTNNEQGLRYLAAVMKTDAEVSLAQLQDMTEGLAASDRSSITFRFSFGSAKPDARALDDIQRLADLLATGDFRNKELLLIGYTDSIGKGTSNTSLSALRAQEIRAALEAVAAPGSLDGIPIVTLGYGEISPLSCNDTDNGRRINRRVEVWFRDIVTASR